MEKNEIALFEKQNIVVFKQMAELKKLKNELEKQEEALKKELEKSMYEYNVKSFKNEYITISYVDESTSSSIDIKKLGEKEPDLYRELLNDYPKITTKKAYVRFLVK